MCSDNASGAVNQQERLDAYLAGFVDGEGSFHVAVQRNPSVRVGWQLVPEFHVSQNRERREVLDLLKQRLACGRIQENHRGSSDTSLVFVVRNREDLLTKSSPSSIGSHSLAPSVETSTSSLTSPERWRRGSIGVAKAMNGCVR